MKYSVRSYLDVRVPMRDGVELCAHVYLPAAEGAYPVLLTRTPYDALARGGELEWAGRGFAYVRQDVRGKFRSEGKWYPWLNEKNDGEDTLAWIAAQPWCDGNIVMYGGSYVSATQSAAAMSGHPALKCFTPCLFGCEAYRANYFGGAFRLGWQTRWTLAPPSTLDQDVLRWHLPLRDMDVFSGGQEIPFWRDVLSHPRDDAFWTDGSMQAHMEEIRAPAFIRTGWFDHFVGDVFDLFHELRERGGSEDVRRFTRIVVGPWPHSINVTKLDEVDFGEAGKVADLFDQEIAFLRHFAGLESDYDLKAAPIRIFVMGANRWRDEYEWPLARTKWTDFFLAGEGRLGGAPSGGADSFDYDPENPVPTLGGAWDFTNVGPRDQSAIEARGDVLFYTSEILSRDLEVTGPVTVKLFASSSAPDTDFTVKLVDVDGDGKPMSVTDGIVRARYRNAGTEPEFLVPGEVAAFTIACNPTAWVFPRGHRVRLEISSSNFPAFSRNLNSGGDIATETTAKIARQTVFHSPEYPSRIILPVIEGED